MERWDVLENELLEMEKAMHRHDDIMEEKDMKKYSMKRDDYFNAVTELLEEDNVKNLDPFERKWVKGKERKGEYSGRRGKNQQPPRASNQSEEIALLKALYGIGDDDDDTDEEKQEEPNYE